MSHIRPERQSRSRNREKSCAKARRPFTATLLEAEDLNQRSSSESSAEKERDTMKDRPQTGPLLLCLQHRSFVRAVLAPVISLLARSLPDAPAGPLPAWRSRGPRLAYGSASLRAEPLERVTSLESNL